MIDFYADWCAACKELDQLTYVEPPVVAESARFVNIKVDGTDESDTIEPSTPASGCGGCPRWRSSPPRARC